MLPRSCQLQCLGICPCCSSVCFQLACHELLPCATLQVYLCARSWQNPAWAQETTPFGHQHNIWRRPVPTQLGKDGSVTFSDGQHAAHVDTVMFCTGYLYDFPFLEDIVSTDDNR